MAEIREELAEANLELGIWTRVKAEIKAGEIAREEAQARFDACMEEAARAKDDDIDTSETIHDEADTIEAAGVGNEHKDSD